MHNIVMKRFYLQYILLTYKLDQLWFPLAFWALFVIVAIIRGQSYLFDTSRAYLGIVIPLVGGIMAAYAILDDPALELRFSTPTQPWRLLIERLGLTLLVQTFTAFLFQAFTLALGGDFSPLGSFLDTQLAWLIPTIALMALGCLASMVGSHSMVGATLVGMIWTVELIARNWLAVNPGKYVLVFMGPLMPNHPSLRANQLSLFLLAIACGCIAWLLLRKQERYI